MAIITISRGPFSGGRILADCLADKLGYRCISGEALVEASKRYDISEERLSQALEDKPGLLERLSSQRARYLAYIRAILIEEGRDEKLVYHGYAGHLLLDDVPHVIRVRIIANMEFRVKALTDHHNLSEEEATGFIEKIDSERAEWTKTFYHVDWNELSLYDIILHIGNIDISSACEAICQLASDPDFQTTPQSLKTLENLALSSHIEALIAGNKSISGKVEIEANEGIITIGGVVGSTVDADRVHMIVRGTPGVKDIISQMRVKFSGVTTKKIDRV